MSIFSILTGLFPSRSASITPSQPLPSPPSQTLINENIDLLRQVRIHLSDEMKAVDTRAGIVIALAAGLSVASFVDVQQGWRFAGVIAALAAALLGLVALLARTGERREPALEEILDRVANKTSKSVIEIETAWVVAIDKALVARKWYLLFSYTAVLISGVAIVLGMEIQALYGFYVGDPGTLTVEPPVQ